MKLPTTSRRGGCWRLPCRPISKTAFVRECTPGPGAPCCHVFANGESKQGISRQAQVAIQSPAFSRSEVLVDCRLLSLLAAAASVSQEATSKPAKPGKLTKEQAELAAELESPWTAPQTVAVEGKPRPSCLSDRVHFIEPCSCQIGPKCCADMIVCMLHAGSPSSSSASIQSPMQSSSNH